MRRRIATYAAALVVAALVAGALLWLFVNKTGSQSTLDFSVASGSSVTSIATSSTLAPPPNTKEYRSSIYHFSLYYPNDLSVIERPGATGSIVVVFEDQATVQGFDIFITPDSEPKITQQRFLMDEPSGVMNDPVNVLIDGAPATQFLSTNPAMGASRKIWFLRGGFLYEVTTPQSLDNWLLQIMQTWQFT